MLDAKAAENRKQLTLLHTPPGAAGSGRVRYGAAMYFYMNKVLSADALEVYRGLAKRDRENPQPFLLALGLSDEFETEKTP